MNGNETDDFEEVEFTDDQLRERSTDGGRRGVERIGATATVDTKAVVDGYVKAHVKSGSWVSLTIGGDEHGGSVSGQILLTGARARHLADQLETAADRLDDA